MRIDLLIDDRDLSTVSRTTLAFRCIPDANTCSTGQHTESSGNLSDGGTFTITLTKKFSKCQYRWST